MRVLWVFKMLGILIVRGFKMLKKRPILRNWLKKAPDAVIEQMR